MTEIYPYAIEEEKRDILTYMYDIAYIASNDNI